MPANPSSWALILGASSGFGEAAALELAANGYSILGIHLDKKSRQAAVDEIIQKIKAKGQRALFFNRNAADAEARQEIFDEISKHLGAGESVQVLFHSLAFGTLKPCFGKTEEESLSEANLAMTLQVMASSLIPWAQGLVLKGWMKAGGRIFAMTSIGSQRQWGNYGAVSAAKAALESYIRQLAFELAPRGIRANAILAGATETPALAKIPEAQKILDKARQENPSGRLTKPEDIAKAIAALCDPRLDWMTGNVLHIDGGETLSA